MTRPNHGGNLNWAASIAGCSPSVILDFSASINPLGPPLSAIAAISKGIEALSFYPDPSYQKLRLALAKFHDLSPEWVLPGNGAAELLTWASWELSSQDITYLLTPAFADYWRSLKTFAVQVKTSPLNLETGAFSLPLPEGKKKLGLLVNNPHNPTGKLFSQAEILPYLAEFNLVVVDEAFMDFLRPAKQQSLIPLLTTYPNLVILRSLTKFYSLPGLRLGYALAHPQRIQQWQEWRDPWPVNILAALAGEAVIQDQSFQAKTWNWLTPTKTQLFESLQKIPQLHPLLGAANFLLVKTDYPSNKLQYQLLEKYRIFIRDCLSFPELGDRYFRIAVRTDTENQQLIKALTQILSAYEG